MKGKPLADARGALGHIINHQSWRYSLADKPPVAPEFGVSMVPHRFLL
jgi:hypothetical protein